MSEPTSKTPEGNAQTIEIPFADKPSPWLNMKSQFFCSVGRAKGIPEASYADLESQSLFADPAASGQFNGRRCTVMIVRYLESPIGKAVAVYPVEVGEDTQLILFSTC